jgi:hypothetical protein
MKYLGKYFIAASQTESMDLAVNNMLCIKCHIICSEGFALTFGLRADEIPAAPHSKFRKYTQQTLQHFN